MKVLVACEYSGVVRDAFRALGHDAMSCDLLPTDVEGPHYQGDVRDILNDGWDLMISHPPCTHLAVSGAGSIGLCPSTDGRTYPENLHRESSVGDIKQDQETRSNHPAVAIWAW